jgi:hypothetical protein
MNEYQIAARARQHEVRSMGTELSDLMNKMTRMILLGSPIENLGVEVTPEIRTAWSRLEEEIAGIQASGSGVAIPVEFDDFSFMRNLNKFPDDQLSSGSARSESSASTKLPRLLRKGSKCPACKMGKLIPIVYGLPDREVMEKSERGELELGGCIITEVIDPGSGFISGDPALFCPKCEGRFFRNGEQSQA